ncbi:MAG: hypothetical protein ACR2H4_13310 [Pyrinomonadaceae bacterium]
MSEKKAIRIVKKQDRTRRQKPAQRKNVPRDTAREIVQTVTNWVNEVQQKRRLETAEAIKMLLPNNPSPSEA